MATLLVVALGCSQSTAASIHLDSVSAAEIRPLFLFQWSLSSNGYNGHAFLLDRGDGRQHIGLTAFHVAGPVIPGTGDPNSQPVVSAWLRSLLTGSPVFRLGERIPIDGAHTIDATDSQSDIAVFKAIDWDSDRALVLGADQPAVGDTVWVLALHNGDRPDAGPRRHPARVAVSDDAAFIYAYLASANTDFTSGAAVLDGRGHVVGINVGTLVPSVATWDSFRARHPGCCSGMIGGEVVGLAVGLRSLQSHLGAIP